MYVALLRGVNVGGKNVLPMKDLAALFAREGCQSVRTYIQSGNVIFDAEPETLRGLPDRISERIVGRFGIKSPVVLRSTTELRQVIYDNPYVTAGAPEEMLHVYFLAHVPTALAVSQLDHQRSLPDTFQVRGKEIYVQLPRGVAYTKLTNAYFDSNLSTVSTSRNWRTVRKLAELAGA
jgi:uncharacterized protein (DUF1697 family)